MSLALRAARYWDTKAEAPTDTAVGTSAVANTTDWLQQTDIIRSVVADRVDMLL